MAANRFVCKIGLADSKISEGWLNLSSFDMPCVYLASRNATFSPVAGRRLRSAPSILSFAAEQTDRHGCAAHLHVLRGLVNALAMDYYHSTKAWFTETSSLIYSYFIFFLTTQRQ